MHNSSSFAHNFNVLPPPQNGANPHQTAANPDFRPFTEAEDGAILAWVERIGNHWKRISEITAPDFGLRDRCQIKHRAKFLMEQIGNEMLKNGTETPPPQDK
jgi:hypothetical protein